MSYSGCSLLPLLTFNCYSKIPNGKSQLQAKQSSTKLETHLLDFQQTFFLSSEDEMFSDIYKIREVANGLCLEVEGKMVTRTEGQIDDSLIGGNASAEGPEGDGTEATVITGVDIVINHHLQETSFTKESYKKYIKDYMKAIKARLEEHKPERVKPFMTGAAEQIKHILANFKNYQFFVGENMNPDGMVALLDFREDGVTPYMIFFKDGLEIEKC
uniref:Tumor protein, translationally-controlled 1 n=8 Tax=Neoaves TaxID=3078114 RepID=A0A8C4U9T2_FALTI